MKIVRSSETQPTRAHFSDREILARSSTLLLVIACVSQWDSKLANSQFDFLCGGARAPWKFLFYFFSVWNFTEEKRRKKNWENRSSAQLCWRDFPCDEKLSWLVAVEQRFFVIFKFSVRVRPTREEKRVLNLKQSEKWRMVCAAYRSPNELNSILTLLFIIQITSSVHRRCRRHHLRCHSASLHGLKQQFLLQVFSFTTFLRADSPTPLLPLVSHRTYFYSFVVCCVCARESPSCECERKHNRIFYLLFALLLALYTTLSGVGKEFFLLGWWWKCLFSFCTNFFAVCCFVGECVWWDRDDAFVGWRERSYLIPPPTTGDSALLTFATETTNPDKPTVRLERECVCASEERYDSVSSSWKRKSQPTPC